MKKIIKSSNSAPQFLDDSINGELRNAINSSAVFYKDEKEKLNWNFLCALMDRIDSCVAFLNRFNPTSSEENFIIFITFSNMIVDGVYNMFKTLNMADPLQSDTSCFSNKGINSDATDDEFFSYLRSLSFAHPLDSNRHPKYIRSGEIQFSPFVIAGNSAYSPNIGIRVYSSIDLEGSHDMTFSFSELEKYIQKKHSLLSHATKWVQGRLESHNLEWAKRKVNRSLTPVGVLNDVLEILKSRYNEWQIYDVEAAISYLSVEITFSENDAPVQKYRDAILKSIPQLCDIVDSLDDEGFNECEFLEVLHPRPKELRQGANYQLEKIFTKLNRKADDYQFGLQQLEAFNKNLAHKYII
jgi:hypothetical protein